MRVGNLDAHGGFAGDALDEERLGAKSEAEIVGQASDAGIFDTGFGLEFESGDDRARVDLRDVSGDAKFLGFLFDGAGVVLQLGFVHFFAVFGRAEKSGRGQPEGRFALRDFGIGSGGLFRRLGDFGFVEFDDGGGARFVFVVVEVIAGFGAVARARVEEFELHARRLFGVLLVTYDGEIFGDALSGRGLTAGNFDGLDAEALALGFTGVAPIFNASADAAEDTFGSEGFTEPSGGGRKRKTSGEKKRGEDAGYADDVSADGIESAAKSGSYYRAHQTAGGKFAANVREVEECEFGGEKEEKHGRAADLGGGRNDGVAAEPAIAEEKERDREEKGRVAAELEHHVGGVGADRADPIVRDHARS